MLAKNGEMLWKTSSGTLEASSRTTSRGAENPLTLRSDAGTQTIRLLFFKPRDLAVWVVMLMGGRNASKRLTHFRKSSSDCLMLGETSKTSAFSENTTVWIARAAVAVLFPHCRDATSRTRR